MAQLIRLLGLGILGVVFIVGVGLSGDKKDKDGAKDKDTPKVKGALPAGWKVLKLTADQKSKVYAIQGEYKTKIAELKKKIEELEAHEKADMIKVLTDDQKAQLTKALIGEDTKDKAPPAKDAKSDKDKSDK
jgi:hypothetical protein